MGDKRVSSINGVEKTSIYIKNEITYYVILYTRVNSKWMKALNIKLKFVKLLEENIGNFF